MRMHYGILLTALLGFAPAAYAANWDVTVGNPNGLSFVPQVLNIAAGDTVTFTNGGGFHNAVSNPGSVTAFRCADGCDGSGGNGDASSTLWSAVVTFPDPGTIGYFCEIHGAPGQGMSGTINVTIPVGLQSFEIE